MWRKNILTNSHACVFPGWIHNFGSTPSHVLMIVYIILGSVQLRNNVTWILYIITCLLIVSDHVLYSSKIDIYNLLFLCYFTDQILFFNKRVLHGDCTFFTMSHFAHETNVIIHYNNYVRHHVNYFLQSHLTAIKILIKVVTFFKTNKSISTVISDISFHIIHIYIE